MADDPPAVGLPQLDAGASHDEVVAWGELMLSNKSVTTALAGLPNYRGLRNDQGGLPMLNEGLHLNIERVGHARFTLSFTPCAILHKKADTSGWQVYFPELREVCYFTTSPACRMLVYLPASAYDNKKPHLYAYLEQIIKNQGPKGPANLTGVAWDRD